MEITVLENESGNRIDKFLAERTEMSRSAIVMLIEDDYIFVNNYLIKKNYIVKEGDSIEINIPEPKKLDIEEQNIPIDIVYEDNDLLVVNKKQGMVVHPAIGNENGTLVNALLFHCKDNLSSINGVIRPGIVHRIDKNTSGLLIVAKTDIAHTCLAEQIKEHSFLREYQGIIIGKTKENSGIINAPIGRHVMDRKKMAVTIKNSREAVTKYELLEEFNGYSLMKFTLKTGRTHQIRVHMSYIGHPIIGDDKYAPQKKYWDLIGQCLHAKKIGFIHPISKKYMEFDSELPDYFQKIIKILKNN